MWFKNPLASCWGIETGRSNDFLTGTGPFCAPVCCGTNCVGCTGGDTTNDCLRSASSVSVFPVGSDCWADVRKFR